MSNPKDNCTNDKCKHYDLESHRHCFKFYKGGPKDCPNYKRLITYQTLYEDVQRYQLPKELLGYEWVAISRSGLAFAQMLAIKYGKSLGVIDPKRMIGAWDGTATTILLIDDVFFTGKTLENCSNLIYFNKIKTLCYLDDPDNKSHPDYFVIQTKEVLDFPWNTKKEKVVVDKYKSTINNNRMTMDLPECISTIGVLREEEQIYRDRNVSVETAKNLSRNLSIIINKVTKLKNCPTQLVIDLEMAIHSANRLVGPLEDFRSEVLKGE